MGKHNQETSAAHSLHGQIPAERRLKSASLAPAKVIRCSEWQQRKNLASHNCAVNLDETLAKGYVCIPVPGQRGDVSTGYALVLHVARSSKKNESNSTETRHSSVDRLLLLFAFRDPWKEWGDSTFQILSQNCHFHHKRLESLEHLNVLFISFLALRSYFLDLIKDAILFLQCLLFFLF